MKERKKEAMVKRGPLGEQKGVREDQEGKRKGKAGHLFLLSTVPFPHPLHLCPEHGSRLSSTVFVPLYLSILPLALLPFLSMFVLLLDPALAFLVSSP